MTGVISLLKVELNTEIHLMEIRLMHKPPVLLLPATIYRDRLTEYLNCGDQTQSLLVNPVATISVIKSPAVLICLEVEKQRPCSPEYIDMSVADTAAVEIDKPTEPPVVENDVW